MVWCGMVWWGVVVVVWCGVEWLLWFGVVVMWCGHRQPRLSCRNSVASSDGSSQPLQID